MSIRLAVTGGRDYSAPLHVYGFLDQMARDHDGIAVLIHGGAKGLDQLADDWARKREVTVMRVPAKWSKYAKAAGPLRNKEILSWCPDALAVFPGGKGTEDMVRRAKAEPSLAGRIFYA